MVGVTSDKSMPTTPQSFNINVTARKELTLWRHNRRTAGHLHCLLNNKKDNHRNRSEPFSTVHMARTRPGGVKVHSMFTLVATN